MQSIFFWKEWASPFKEIYHFLFIIFIASAGWMLYAYFQGTNLFIDWNILGDTETTEVTIDTFSVGPFTLSTTADNSIFYQRYAGSAPQINTASYYIFLIICILAANILLTLITTLSRFWYYVGAGLFILFLVNLKLELLLLFESDLKIGLITAFVLFLPTSYYFNVIRSEISFTKRLATFLGLTILMALLIYFASGVNAPFFHMATSGLVNPMILSILFILLVSNEIISAMIYILTKANNASSKNTLTHFLVLVLIYLANLTLAYLKEANIVEWDLLYVNLFVLLFLSAAIGIWGYRQREEQYGYLFQFTTVGAIFYITMGIVCFTTISHFMTTGNDPAVEVFRDFIIYGHLGYGTIFILYIIANFIAPLKDNMQVYKVLYKPIGMPYFTFRLAGTIAVAAFVLKSNWQVPLNQSISGYYNGLGDLHVSINESLLAQKYYQEAADYGFNNHKSNYTLGYLAAQQGRMEEAQIYYEDAITKWPSPYAYINLSNLYKEEGNFFKGLFTLQEGEKTFPTNGNILNNLGLAYGKTNLLDTTLLYLDQAYQDNTTRELASSNILAMITKNNVNIDADTVLQEYDIADDPISVNNNIVLNNLSQKPYSSKYEFVDSSLSLLDASIMYNSAFNSLFDSDSLATQNIYSYANLSANVNYRESLRYIASLNLYKNQDVNRAFRRLNWTANRISDKSGKYFDHVGLWALEQEAPDVAIDYFKWAIDENFEDAKLHLAIALTENRNVNEAVAAWSSLNETEDVGLRSMASNLIALLSLKSNEIAELTDNQKYLFLRYHISHNDTVLFNEILPTINTADYRAQAILDMAQKLWKEDLPTAAITYYTQLGNIEISNQELFDQIQRFELNMLAGQGNTRGLAQKINQGIEFGPSQVIEKAYYTALLNEVSNDSIAAKANYEFIAYKNPFKVETVIAAANYIGRKDRFEAYNILLSALEVNPRSIRLLKAYILQCARIQSERYAENSFETLSELISKSRLDVFRKQYELLLKEVEEAEASF